MTRVGQKFSMPKEYPKSDIYERAYLLKLYHNEYLLNEHLDKTYPNVFLNKDYRLIIYLMKELHKNKTTISIDNMAMLCANPDDRLNIFIKKHSCKLLSYEELHDILYEPGLDTTDRLFDEARKEVLNRAFSRFIEDITTEMKYLNTYVDERYHPSILGKARAMWKVHNIIYGTRDSRNQLDEAKERINSRDEYISTSSQVLNSYIGGFTRKFVASVIAKSSHAKSSWIDYNTLHSILSGKVNKVVKITPEEDAATQYRRYIAMICNISTTAMRLKSVDITDEHIKMVEDKLQNKLIIIDDVFKYKDILEVMHSITDADQVIVDHLQAIEYPGRGSFLVNMIGNIPGLVQIQKKIAKQRNMSIINVSQVNDKDIARSDRIIKAPRFYDAYGSSVLYQASREFLALWYPFRDWEDQMINPGKPPTEGDIQISVEKSSFSKIGKIMLHFNPEFNIFTDMSTKQLDKLDYVAPTEEITFNF